MALKLNSSSGGSVTLQEPTTASNYTLTLPAQTGTVAINGPAFSAYMGSNQTPTSGVHTKIAFDVEEFDTASCYNNSTYRFTPTVAGYYQVNMHLSSRFASGVTRFSISIRKNGTSFKEGLDEQNHALFKLNLSSLIYLNGTTDYIEGYGYMEASSPQFSSGDNSVCYFQAYLVRAA